MFPPELVLTHLRERERVRFLITCKTFRSHLETRMQKAHIAFNASKAHGWLDNDDCVNFPVTFMEARIRHTWGIENGYRRCAFKVNLQTDGLICIRTIDGFVADTGEYTSLPGSVRYIAPWENTLIYSDGREVRAERDTEDTVLNVLMLK